jgi:hypothetical protein
MRRVSQLLCVLLALPGASGLAQIGSGAGTGSGTATVELSSGTSNFVAPLPVAGQGGEQSQPYTMTQQTTTLRTLADGTHITTVRTETRYRDAEGRTRTETNNETGRPVSFVFVNIMDPVNHTWVNLDERNKVAHVNQIPAPHKPTPEEEAAMAAARAKAEAARAAQETAPTPRPHRDMEKLPPRIIAGVTAEGRRVTQTIPAGTQGNDRDLTIVTETWNSPELHVMLERTTDDPRTGKTTMITTSLERASPDPGLFQIPPDYKVVQQQQSSF